MKRSEFIATYTDLVSSGRAKHHPDMRPSEIAAAHFHDLQRAGQVWRKHRAHFAAMSVEQFRADELQARRDEVANAQG